MNRHVCTHKHILRLDLKTSPQQECRGKLSLETARNERLKSHQTRY